MKRAWSLRPFVELKHPADFVHPRLHRVLPAAGARLAPPEHSTPLREHFAAAPAARLVRVPELLDDAIDVPVHVDVDYLRLVPAAAETLTPLAFDADALALRQLLEGEVC